MSSVIATVFVLVLHVLTYLASITCNGVSICNGVSTYYDVSTCNGISTCNGVSTCNNASTCNNMSTYVYLIISVFYYYFILEKPSNFLGPILGILRGWGGWPNSNFFCKIGQSKIAFINGQKCDETHIHNIIHKWGGNILSIYEGIGAPHSPVPFLFTKK